MKIKLLAIFLLTACNSAFSQDSLTVSFTEETDSLPKQHFVDRYANVFMTKVPTRHMFKLSVVDSRFAGLGVYAGYEYKIRPAWSLEAGIYAQFHRFNNSLYFELSRLQLRNIHYWAFLKARWYFNMQKRIEAGLNSNNFTGMYLGLSHEYVFRKGYQSGSGNITGLTLGLKTRFLNHGNMDLGISLYNRQLGVAKYAGERPTFANPKDFILSTQRTFGIALGDWKRNPNPALCDVLVCDEVIRSQWKIGLPDVWLGLMYQMVSASAAYEVRIGNTPLSAQVMTEASFFRFGSNSLFGQASASLQLRYYFLQSIRFKKGAGGSNFSGPYFAGSGEYYYTWDGKNRYEISNSHHYGNPVANVGVGYQQRLFGKVFFDGSLFYRESYPMRKWVAAGAPSRVGDFSSKLTIGFTF